MKHYFLGMGAGYESAGWFEHLVTIGRKKDLDELTRFLSQKYSGKAILTKNGRSALALALKAYFKPGDGVIVNGFTCYAVYEAVKKAGLTPVFADISREDLNYDVESLEKCFESSNTKKTPVRGIIIQNTFGNPVDIKAISKFAKEHELVMIEDLAHSAGIRYDNKKEAGTVGAACILSFGKEKAIDTISGGALVLRDPSKNEIKMPSKAPKLSDHLRARVYPMLSGVCRGLTYVKIGGGLMRFFVKIHWVEKSADNRLDLERRLSCFEAKLALRRLKDLRRNGEPPIREFCYVKDREKLLAELQKKGYFFGGFWYEKPVSPVRYYDKVHFPEKSCKNAVYASEHIVNLPLYYSKRDLDPARKIIQPYLIEEKEGKKEHDGE